MKSEELVGKYFKDGEDYYKVLYFDTYGFRCVFIDSSNDIPELSNGYLIDYEVIERCEEIPKEEFDKAYKETVDKIYKT